MVAVQREPSGLTLCTDPAEERRGIEVVDEGPLAVDLDDRKPLAVPLLELLVTADIDLAELEVVLAPKLCERAPGTLAEVAVLGVVEDDARSRDRAPASSWPLPHAGRQARTRRAAC